MKKFVFRFLGTLGLALTILTNTAGATLAQSATDTGVITLADLGRTEVFLNGPYDTHTITFGLPAYWDVKVGVKLNLNVLSVFNTALQEDGTAVAGGTLTVKFNRDTIAVLPINSIGNHEFSIPVAASNLISPRPDGQMELRFELDSAISCKTNQHMDMLISTVSSISIPYREKMLQTHLADFPRPIYQSSLYPDQALIVVPDNANAAEMKSAITIAAGLGNLTSNGLVLDLATQSQLTPQQRIENHLIIVGRAASVAAFGNLPLPLPQRSGTFALAGGVDDGVVQMINSPWSNRSVVLLVSGNTDAGLMKAAQAVSTGIIRANTEPNLALVGSVQELPSAIASVSEPTFADLGYDQILLDTRGVDSNVFNFYVLPDTTVSSGAYFALNYGHSALLDYNVSGLVILLNGQPIGSVRFTEETAKQTINEARITIPPALTLPGINQLEIRSSLEPIDNCLDPNLEGLWTVIWPDSKFHLPVGPVQVNTVSAMDLRMYPAPMVFDSTLGDTAFVLGKGDEESWKLAVNVAAFLGGRSRGTISKPEFIFDDELSKSDLSKYNLIVIGRPSQMSILKELNESLPVPFEQSADVTSKEYSEVTYRIPSDTPLGYVEFLTSPWNPERVVIAALGNTAEGVQWATSVLYNPVLRQQLAGNFVVINGSQVQSTDTRVGLQLEIPTVAPVAVLPPVAEPLDLTAPPASRPAWILSAIGIIGIIIVLILLFVFWKSWSNWRSSLPH